MRPNTVQKTGQAPLKKGFKTKMGRRSKVILLIVVLVVLLPLSFLLYKVNMENIPVDTETSATIGPAGGTLEITDLSSPLCGTRVEIPEGALEQEVKIAIIAAQKNIHLPEGFVSAGEGIELMAESAVFNNPVSITVPYLDQGINENTIGVYKYDPESKRWIIQPFKNINTDQNIITVQTFTFSPFYPLALEKGEELSSESPLILFDPQKDGLDTPNIKNCFDKVSSFPSAKLAHLNKEPVSDYYKFVDCPYVSFPSLRG